MKQITIFLFFMAFMSLAMSTQAQEFKSAVGVRFGSPMSVSYKYFLNESSAVEVYAGTRGSRNFGINWRWYSVSAAYQIHKPLNVFDIDGLNYYYGLGATAFFWNYDFDTDFNSTSFGLQGYLGLSYTFTDKRVNLSLDWIPTYLLGNGYNRGFGADYGSLSVRYVLGEGE